MEDSILKLITIGYALGIGIVGVMAYLGIKGTNEAIDYQNSRLRKHDEWRKNNDWTNTRAFWTTHKKQSWTTWEAED